MPPVPTHPAAASDSDSAAAQRLSVDCLVLMNFIVYLPVRVRVNVAVRATVVVRVAVRVNLGVPVRVCVCVAAVVVQLLVLPDAVLEVCQANMLVRQLVSELLLAPSEVAVA